MVLQATCEWRSLGSCPMVRRRLDEFNSFSNKNFQTAKGEITNTKEKRLVRKVLTSGNEIGNPSLMGRAPPLFSES